MKRVKELIEASRRCRDMRKNSRIKWHIRLHDKDTPACSFFFIPTIVYNTYPYLQRGWPVFNIYFLHWYIDIGEWVDKEEN